MWMAPCSGSSFLRLLCSTRRRGRWFYRLGRRGRARGLCRLSTGLLLHGLIWFKYGAGNAAVAILVSLDAIALALVGPGGYSVDASRFGRRVVVLPPT